MKAKDLSQKLKASAFAQLIKAITSAGFFGYLRRFVEVVPTNDNLDIAFGKSVSDVALTSDQSTQTTIKRPLNTAQAGEQATLLVDFVRSFQEEVGLSDVAALSAVKSLQELSNLEDRFVGSVNKSVADTGTTLDNVSLTIAQLRSESTQVNIVVQKLLTKISADIASTSDSGAIFLQSYGSSDYFESQYVGSPSSF